MSHGPNPTESHGPDLTYSDRGDALTLPPLYAIVDEEAATLAGHSVSGLGRTFLDGGARLVQVRAKLAPGARFLADCEALRDAAHPYGALVVVNDRFDVALAAGLRAVHVGQDDLPPSLVRRFLGSDGIIGLSTHTREQVVQALYEPVDYLAVGPVYGTRTKETGYEPVGLDLVAFAASKTTLPIVAIGGITLETALDALDAGATSVAVIGDLLRGGDPAARVAEYVAVLRGK